jgi:hypothetical protein
MSKKLLIGFAIMMLAGCSYRLDDTNGVYMKAEKARPVKCVQESDTYTRCYSYGQPKKLTEEAYYD